MIDIFPRVVLRLGPLAVTDTMVASALISLIMVLAGLFAFKASATRPGLEVVYDALEQAIVKMVDADVSDLVPLITTMWIFIAFANLAGLLPGVASPTRDLSIAAALAAVSFVAGHVHAFRKVGIGYVKRYIEPSPILLPFNIVGEISRTIALALRLFGNMLSGALIGAIAVYLAGLLVPVPLMLLSVLTGVVQAYIFGVLTLVFAAGAAESASRSPLAQRKGKKS